MDTDYFIKLTLFVYRLTEEWEESSNIRLRIRRGASEVLRTHILVSAGARTMKKEFLGSINFVKEALEWARKDKVLTRKDFVFLRDSYNMARESVSVVNSINVEESPKKMVKPAKNTASPVLVARTSGGLKDRESKIVSVLKRDQRAQVNDLKAHFPDISKRTLRRDIDSLLKKGLIVRNGEWNDVFYTLS